MIERKKKLRITQFILLLLGVTITYFAYYNEDSNNEEKIITKSLEEKVKKQNLQNNQDSPDIFYNIEYTGIDLNGNRYLLKSKEAQLDENRAEIVYMKTVQATFYFKDDTVLYVWADKGIYNNKSLDMKFEDNVKANYLSSELFAEKADYSNTENYLSIYDNVRINDNHGNLIADKLLFDITKQNLNITSFNGGKINAKVKLDEKRF